MNKITSKADQRAVKFGDIELRSYQVDAIHHLERSGHHGILAMATGTGKTPVALGAISEWSDVFNNVLIVVPSLLLLNQWKEAISDKLPKIHAWTTSDPDYKDRIILPPRGSGVPSVLIATMQTAHRMAFRNWYMKRFDPGMGLIIVDEVHRIGSASFSHVLELEFNGRIGLSATPTRQWDFTGTDRIEAYFGSAVFQYTLADAICEDVITPYFYTVHTMVMDADGVAAYQKISVGISRLINQLKKRLGREEVSLEVLFHRLEKDPEAMKDITILRQLLIKRSLIIKKAFGKSARFKQLLESENIRKCLIYCQDHAHIDDITAVLKEWGLRYGVYTSHLDTEQRKKVLEMFCADSINFIVSIRCLDEGVDIPDCRSAIVLASSTSTREFIQRRGRLLRKAPEKTYADIHDIIVLPFDFDSIHHSLEEWEIELIIKEYQRAWVFSDAAINRDEVQKSIRSVLMKLGMTEKDIDKLGEKGS